MRGKQVRKPPKKGPRLDGKQLRELSLWWGLNTDMSEWSVQEWADQLNGAWMHKKKYVLVGRFLALARRVLPHGTYGRLFKKHPQAVARPLLMSDRTAERLIRLARHPTLPELLAHSTHGSNFPSSWRTLAELACLAPGAVEHLLTKEQIHPKMTRHEACWWRAKVRKLQGGPAVRPVYRCERPICGHRHLVQRALKSAGRTPR
ncbi:MAG: hypothetical protein E6K65_04475 [Nitrospirae bacterium]|nr:MAG: hypothetical protein E6K65_04475 [Nitrospirota bacterium]